MCMADGGDGPDFFSTTTFKARKAHKCGECHREIAPGETYERHFGYSDGSSFSGKTCAHCLVLADWLAENCDGYIFGSIIEDFGEHAADYNRDDIGAVAAMARRDWRNSEGEMLPLPLKPPPIKLGDARP